jgi:hypothetical protein
LRQLERIFARSKRSLAEARDEDADPATLHLAGVPGERLRLLTAELRACPDAGQDETAALAIRLLLSDYGTAVGHLRAVSRLAAARVDAAAATIRECQKAVRREQKLRIKRAASE